MKCIYCGDNLNIDDTFCSSCGKENVHAVQHRKDMELYHDDYHRTRQVMFEKSGRKVNIIVKGTVILVLALACFILIYATTKAYKINNWFKRIEISKDIKSHKKNLELLEAERDFFGLASYYEANDLYLSNDLREYRALVYKSSDYLNIYNLTFQLLNPEKYPYSSPDRLIKNISDCIAGFYDSLKFIEDLNYEDEQYSETHLATIMALKSELEIFINVYLKVPREVIETFQGLSYAKIHIIIEGSLSNAN